MKHIFLSIRILCAALVIGCGGTASSSNGGKDFTAEGVGQGYRGMIRVLVTANRDGIQDIEILEHTDDPSVGGEAMEILLEAALNQNSLNLDAVSGATESSEGFLTAVRNALSERGIEQSPSFSQ
jgi:fumarate reductase flavoprotein subunit